MGISYNHESRQVILENGRLELKVDIKDGLNPSGLRDIKSGRAYADADYIWVAEEKPILLEDPVIENTSDGSSVTFKAKMGLMHIKLGYTFSKDDPDALKEFITISNPTFEQCGQRTVPRPPRVLDTSGFACGFGKKVMDENGWLADAANTNLCEMPYRRHNETGELRDDKLSEFLKKESWYSIVRSPDYHPRQSTAYGSEAWVWYDEKTAFMFSKYNPDSMEWSIIEKTKKYEKGLPGTIMRFGGAARWKLGDPEGAAKLLPGASFSFGETRYRIMDGGFKEAFADYREYNDRKGHKLPENFNNPVHWNELYDNRYWWEAGEGSWHLDRSQKLAELYRHEDMRAEIDKAAEIGCECFYMDPGWDTDFSSNFWDEKRLGKQADFAEMLKASYGMELALHTPLAPWTCNASYPVEARQMNSEGNRREDLCTASRQYIDVKVERLRELCKNGAYFLMYDGSWYEKPCYDPNHGHSVPSTRQEHVDAILQIQQKLHEEYPNAVIEQHDPITGPGTPRYTPTYFMHGKPGAFDELWGFEFMINLMDDLKSGRAYSLYYLNLAYNIPVYLHIDLRTDNENGIGFWWFASTCRHFGFGGKHKDIQVWETHKKAMKLYMENKRFFAQGEFYGVDDELVHVHTLKDIGESVINCFNMSDEEVRKVISFRLKDVGLPDGKPSADGKPTAVGKLKADGASLKADGSSVKLEVTIPAMSHKLVKLKVGR